MNKILWFIGYSLKLDYGLFRNCNYSIVYKIKFIALKYYLIFKHVFVRFELGNSFCYLDGKKFYYDTKYGLAGYQGVLVNHTNLLNINKIKDVSIIIDVGANVGCFSKLCRFLYPESHIYSFEPIPRTFDCLKLNFDGDLNTEVYNYAISNFNGKTKMNFNTEDSAISQISNTGNIDVNVLRLDDFVYEHNINHIDILKIDTETFENFVLSGASNILKNTRYILIEITIDNNENYTISSLFKLLSSDEYDFQLVGFRNFADRNNGHIPLMDALLKNTKI